MAQEATVVGPELVRNGGFEEPPATPNEAPHWGDNSSWAPVKVAYAADTATPQAGQRAWKIECTSFKGGAVQFAQYGIPLDKGAVYRISLWMKGKVDSPVELLLRKGPAPYTTYTSHLFTVNEKWTQYSFDSVCEESDAEALLIIRFGAVGTLFIDDVSCRRVGTEKGMFRLQPPAKTIPHTYFGLHLHLNNKDLPWPPVKFGSLRLWDAHVSWPQLEPEKGKWEWERLDNYLDRAEAHGVEVLLPLGLTPTWASARPKEKSAYNDAGVDRNTGWAAEPRDFGDWDNYVRTVAIHCGNRVRQYEVWNEPNAVPFFSGTVDQLVDLTRRATNILREVDEKNIVLSPSIVGDALYLDNFWRKYQLTGAPATDVVGFHFYVWPEPPEKMVSQIRQAQDVLANRKLTQLPLWNTEAGWNIAVANPPASDKELPNGKPLDMATAGDYVARAYILNWAAGVERYYFYAWDNELMGLVEKDGTLKPAARGYSTTYNWLVGSRMESCTRDAAGTWVVQLLRPGGSRERIVWNADKRVDFVPPAEWRARKSTNLAGETQKLEAGKGISVNGSPVLFGG